jgi:hypothetical protein
MTADPEPVSSPPPELPRGVRSLILTGAVVTTTAGVLGTAFLPYLAVEQPLLLLVSSADARNLVLVAPRVDWPTAALITIPRRVLAMAVTYGLGLLYGRGGVPSSARGSPGPRSRSQVKAGQSPSLTPTYVPPPLILLVRPPVGLEERARAADPTKQLDRAYISRQNTR